MHHIIENEGIGFQVHKNTEKCLSLRYIRYHFWVASAPAISKTTKAVRTR